MSIKSAKWKSETNLISKKTENYAIELIYNNDEKYQVPLVEGNRHYDEIMAAAAAGALTIEEAD
mgnify:CR=1 FL=1|tara:strand:- start:304 stop:495 length:192 start_codon:yes stop_codon:yes gene_type:complete